MRPLRLDDKVYPIHIQKFEGKWYACGTLQGFENSYFDLCASRDAKQVLEQLAISGVDFERVVNHNLSAWNAETK